MPRFRTGHRVPLNVYDGDRPIFQAHSEEDAERFVALMNLGERVETVTAAEIAQHIEGAFDDLAAKLALDGLPSGRTVAEHLAPVVMAEVLLVSHPSDLSAPVAASGPPPATGQPADDSGPRDGALSILRRLYRPTEKAPDPNWEWEIEVPPGDHDPGPHWVRVDRHSRSWEYFEPLTPAERAAWEQLS